ncbi:DUF5714 domain-containing protein [Ruminococcus sp. 5_1_39BFAA]|uniref:DUF5714 domain-containing protein n=1 Tax=Ruminococcus sp. 5_1_39BFAA TaxID=457412 RepID=UPI003569AAC9
MDYYVAIKEKCMGFLEEKETRTIWEWAMECMDLEGLPMHCPQHHFLFPAVLLTACAREDGQSEEKLSKMLNEAEKRAKKVLGGFCGYYGNCGAGVGVGIFLSVYTETSPLSDKSWQWVNEATGRSLIHIASVEGPRCCKRNGFLAFEEAVEIIQERLGIELKKPEKITCHYFSDNKECKKEKCPYYPGK